MNPGSSLSRVSDPLVTYTTAPGTYSSSSVDTKSWGLSQFLPGQTGQYTPVTSNTGSSEYVPQLEPPPAHSGKIDISSILNPF